MSATNRNNRRSSSSDDLQYDFRVKYRGLLVRKSTTTKKKRIVPWTSIYKDVCIIFGAVTALTGSIYVVYQIFKAELGVLLAD